MMTNTTRDFNDAGERVTVHTCLIPSCDWAHTSTEPKLPPEALAGVFGTGTMTQIALNNHHRKVESELEEHYSTHGPVDWVPVLAKALNENRIYRQEEG